MYEAYMADTNTPAAVRHAKKSVVLRLLANRAVDRYETIPTNCTARWKFRVPDCRRGIAARMRFTNQLEIRQDVRGEFRFGGLGASVSNITQAVLTVPLRPVEGVCCEAGVADELTFANNGKSALMLRPRRDIKLLTPADAFWRNLLRAYVEMVSLLALVAHLKRHTCVLGVRGLEIVDAFQRQLAVRARSEHEHGDLFHLYFASLKVI